MNVQSILATKGNAVATIKATSTLSEAVVALRDHGVGALVVSADGDTIEGILSERDVVRLIASHGDDTMKLTVGVAMSSNVITCAPADSIDSLMEMMTERRIRHLPVLAASATVLPAVCV